mmetsp:Transcript_7092/g.17115  ORF Transcript_7092/g.17115 Transcript_7092/m.17115 type:complete len:197 (+) Transcript_7092:65-655(+)
MAEEDKKKVPASSGSITETLRQFAAEPWFAIVVGAGSGINMFTLVLTTPLVILFCTGVISNPKKWFRVAFFNALGTLAGCAILSVMVDAFGTEYIRQKFPTTFESQWWAWTEEKMQTYGFLAIGPIAAMPIILHPLIFFAKLTKTSPAVLLISIFVGRLVKYAIMANVAMTAPSLLKYFGASKEVISEVSGTKKDK